MNAKIHLLIISAIVLALYVAWQWIDKPQPEQAAVQEKSPFSITVTHASWGLNCQGISVNNGAPPAPADAFLKNGPTTGTNPGMSKDNVLARVSDLCNGKTDCDIPLEDGVTLGADPLPACRDKQLEVEYRCFSYDRPWTVRASAGLLSLHCNHLDKDKPIP